MVLKQINTPRFFAMLFKHFEIHFSLLLNLHMELIKQKATITETKGYNNSNKRLMILLTFNMVFYFQCTLKDLKSIVMYALYFYVGFVFLWPLLWEAICVQNYQCFLFKMSRKLIL